MVQDAHERGEEDDCRQHLKCKKETETALRARGVCERAEYKSRAVGREAEYKHEEAAQLLKHPATRRGFEDQQREAELQPYAYCDKPPGNTSAIGGKNKTHREHQHDPKKTAHYAIKCHGYTNDQE